MRIRIKHDRGEWRYRLPTYRQAIPLSMMLTLHEGQVEDEYTRRSGGAERLGWYPYSVILNRKKCYTTVVTFDYLTVKVNHLTFSLAGTASSSMVDVHTIDA